MSFVNLIHPWQTLIGGLIAIVVALIAVWNTNRTLENAGTLEKHRRARKHAALRAAFPLVLSQISDYAETITDQLSALDDICAGEVLHHSSVAPPNFPPTPEAIVATLVEFIESSDTLNTKLPRCPKRAHDPSDGRGHGSDQRSAGGVS